jgi:hypothetical protein
MQACWALSDFAGTSRRNLTPVAGGVSSNCNRQDHLSCYRQQFSQTYASRTMERTYVFKAAHEQESKQKRTILRLADIFQVLSKRRTSNIFVIPTIDGQRGLEWMTP